MAWRLADHIVHGEVDNRIKNSVTGFILLAGQATPIQLDLRGNAWRDLAGHLLRFRNPDPKPLPEGISDLAELQQGVVGDITAARKLKVPDCTMDEVVEYYQARKPIPYHWSNCLYLEWFSQSNGRVVIESPNFELKVEGGPAWHLTKDEETEQLEANNAAIRAFMEQLLDSPLEILREGADLGWSDHEEPQSQAEAEADAEDAWMSLLLDRISARMHREALPLDEFSRVMDEERARLRRERGEPEPDPLTPEQEAEREAWIAELNGDTDGDLTQQDRGADRHHPLVEQCQQLGMRVHREIESRRWLPEDALDEHPLRELQYGIVFAAAKLAGALHQGTGAWPPDELSAGQVLVRLKKARGHLEDAIAGLDSAESERLAESEWLRSVREELGACLGSVGQLIHEVRETLRDAE